MVLVVPGQLIDFDRRQQQSAVFRDRRRSVEVEDLQARVPRHGQQLARCRHIHIANICYLGRGHILPGIG